jgi:hypothetical protein
MERPTDLKPITMRSVAAAGRSHSLWLNPKNGMIEAIPRHRETKEPLAKKIVN